ncbi:MAG: response regulator [Lachnospiraceae bacterium]|nr:response regulator [Lachnospiraceae bacterium]
MNLLICEDEDIIRKGFLLTIKKLNICFDQIYEAKDGLQGLQMCKDYHPDIIITDIQMPLMDGLTFIAKAKELSPHCQFIILSGFDNFEYARTAMKYGVKDYLLKPCSKQEIYDSLTQTIEKIENAQRQDEELLVKERNYKQVLNQLQKLFLGDLLLGKYSPSDLTSQAKFYNIKFEGHSFLVLCFHIASETHNDDNREHSNWLCSLLTPCFSFYPVETTGGIPCMILMLQKAPVHYHSIWNVLTEEIKSYNARHQVHITFSLSHATEHYQTLPEQYQEACQLLSYRFFNPDKVCFSADFFDADAPSSCAIPNGLLESLFHTFVGKSQFDFHQSLYQIFQYISAQPELSPSGFSSCIEGILQYLSVQVIKNNDMTSGYDALRIPVSELFIACDTIHTLYTQIYRELTAFRQALLRNMESTAPCPRTPIEQAIAYIDNNYNKDLDLASISKMVSMNSSYFSTQFKKKTGLSFSTYIQTVRLEKGKNALLYTNKKLAEIAESIGINNVKYFCKLFKEYTGLTPTEYKNQNKRDPS